MAVWVREWDGGKRGGGKKAWWVFIKHEGKRKARRIGPGPEGRWAAMLVAEQLRAKIALWEFNLNDEPRLTLAAFAARWLDGHVEHNLRPTTAPKYREVMRKHWLPRLGSMALRDITRATIRAHVQQLQRDYQNNTIRWFLNVPQSCLAAAVADGHLADNPALHSTKGLWRGNAGRNRDIDVFTKPEIMALLRRAEAIAPMTHMMVLTLARTGLRISELLGLRVEDLDFERREIHLRRTWGNHSRGPDYYGIPKSGKTRIVDMSQQLKSALQTWVASLPQPTWLFPASHGRPPTPNTFYPVHWKPLFKDSALITYRHPHVLRHSYATHLLQQRESPVYVKEQLGHASIRITVDLYGHAIRTWGKDAVDRLDDVGSSEVKSGTSTSGKGLWIVKGGGS
jgi:integrase